jgi:hypothetical protein
MHRLHNVEFHILYLHGGVRVLVFRSGSGGTIGVECNEETANRWAALIAAPTMPDGHERLDRGGEA